MTNWRINQQLRRSLSRDVLAAHLADGTTLRQLAAETGFSRQAITRRMKADGIAVRSGGRRSRAVDIEWLSRRYFTDHATANQIADEAGTTATTILRQLHAKGIPVRPRGGSAPGSV